MSSEHDRRLMAALGDLVGALVDAGLWAPQARTAPPAMRREHQPWRCEACGELLGWYDTRHDTLRIVGQIPIQVRVGIGGSTTMVCHACGMINTISDTTNTPDKPTG